MSKRTYTVTYKTHYRLFQGALYSQHHFYLREQPSLHHERSLSQPISRKEKTQNETRKMGPKELPQQTHKPWVFSQQSIQGHYLSQSGPR